MLFIFKVLFLRFSVFWRSLQTNLFWAKSRIARFTKEKCFSHWPWNQTRNSYNKTDMWQADAPQLTKGCNGKPAALGGSMGPI